MSKEIQFIIEDNHTDYHEQSHGYALRDSGEVQTAGGILKAEGS
jgi:hypothetical protein